MLVLLVFVGWGVAIWLCTIVEAEADPDEEGVRLLRSSLWSSRVVVVVAAVVTVVARFRTAAKLPAH